MTPSNFYHIYNRGNNSQVIFYNNENYLYFLRKVRMYFLPHLEVLAYCLMPNHFHFLVYSNKNVNSEKFSNDLKVFLRSYTRAINKQENRSGSLFQQNTKVKPLDEALLDKPEKNYPFICFNYIHQNPMKAKLVRRMEEWEMSSFRDYAGLREGTLCNRQLPSELLDIPGSHEEFTKMSYAVQIIDENLSEY